MENEVVGWSMLTLELCERMGISEKECAHSFPIESAFSHYSMHWFFCCNRQVIGYQTVTENSERKVKKNKSWERKKKSKASLSVLMVCFICFFCYSCLFIWLFFVVVWLCFVLFICSTGEWLQGVLWHVLGTHLITELCNQFKEDSKVVP